MQQLVLESWILLLRFEWIVRSGGFNKVYRIVRERPVHLAAPLLVPQEDLCRAMDYACVFYFKRVRCLQRSAATTLLLRRHGWRAQMVIGAQLLPFRSHAWCEINGAVINDKPYMQDIYAVLERC
jgi:hypothetical protein